LRQRSVTEVEEILNTKNYVRESKRSQSIAVGSKSFVERVKFAFCKLCEVIIFKYMLLLTGAENV
jgi:hypothetical protein